ncbi:MAG: mercuric transporter MerT family protein [Gemmatimonadota bacterium]
MNGRPALSVFGAVGAAFASSLCCIGPLLYVGLGVGAGLASTFEPLRPWFLGGTALFLGLGFYGVYGPPARCEGECEAGRSRRREKVMLWLGTGAVLILATFPTWSTWLL